MFTLSKTNINTNTIEYFYDTNGIKLKKTVTDNNASPVTVVTTHYIDGFQYTEDKLDFFPHAEGYVKVTHASSGGVGGGSTNYNYVFNYTDHLGNIRLRYAINPANQWLEILEEDHYYPFGLKHNGYNAQNYVFMSLDGGPVELIPTNPNVLETYKYKFNGKEHQDEFGINVYDFGARNYQPDLGRWMNMDALSDLYPDWSPYNYTLNNPIFYIDPDGNYVDVSFIYEKDDEGNYKNQNLVEAFEVFATSKAGIAFLSNYAEEGQVIAGIEYGKSGEFHNNGIDLGFGQLAKGDHAEGRTGYEESERGLNITINLREKGNTDNYIKTIGHEGFLHADKYSVDYSDDRQINFSSGIDKDIVKYVESLINKQNVKERFNHHFQERRDKVLEKKLVPILQSYYQSKGIKKPVKEVKDGVSDFTN